MPSSNTYRLRSELILKSMTGLLSARFIVIPETRIMEHLPCRLGEDRALDDAVKLICTSDPSETIPAYGTALQSLQASIDCKLSSETLGAATLLQMHDLFQNAGPVMSWAVHARGVIDMLKFRGPEGLQTGFDRCLLQAQVGNITFDALREKRPCFLALPARNAYIRPLSRKDGADNEQQTDWDMCLIAIGVHIPGLLCRFEALKDAKGVTRDRDDVLPNLRTHILLRDLRCNRQGLDSALNRVTRDDSKNTEYMGQSNRLRPALLLSGNIYLAMMHYMLEEVQCAIGEVEEGTVRRRWCHDVTPCTVRALFQRLYRIDPVALRSTVEFLKLTLERVLTAMANTRKRKWPLSTVLDEIYNVLSSPLQACQDELSDGRVDKKIGPIS